MATSEALVDVGIRELRDGLSRHLAAVRAGETITVTDHGTPIARIVPVTGMSVIERLEAEGVLSKAGRPKSSHWEPVQPKEPISAVELVDWVRGPREEGESEDDDL